MVYMKTHLFLVDSKFSSEDVTFNFAFRCTSLYTAWTQTSDQEPKVILWPHDHHFLYFLYPVPLSGDEGQRVKLRERENTKVANCSATAMTMISVLTNYL